MNNQSFQDQNPFCGIKRETPRWLSVLAFIAVLLVIGGWSNSFIREIIGGSGKVAVTEAPGMSLWTTNGPYGGQIRSVAIDPVTSTTVYAAGIGGAFKSIDGGTTWTPSSTGITRYDQHIIVNAVAVSPGNNNVLFAAENTGFYKSVDGGTSWSSAGSAFVGSRAQTIAFDPTNANKIFVSANDRIYRSVDGGNTWIASFSGLNGTTPYSIAVAPGAVYTGTSNGLFKSVDGGVTWAASSNGFPVIGGGNSSPILTLTVAVDPKTPTTLYATPRGLLHKSVDGGANWTALNAPGGYYFALDAQTPTNLYISGEGVSKSADGGVTWTTSNTGLSLPGYPKITSGGPLAVNSSLTGTVFFGTFGGIFRSTNGGNTWAASNTGLANVTVHVVAVDPLTPTTIYGGTRDLGIFKSTDGGASWMNSSNGLLKDTAGTFTGDWVLSLAIDPVTPSTIYAGTLNFVFKSIDSGATWKPARTGIGASTYLTPALAINPLNPKIVVAGTLGSGIFGGIFLSTDGAATWTQIRAGLPDSATIYGLSFSTMSPQTLLAAVSTNGSKSFMFSSDSGSTWSATFPGYEPSRGAISAADFLNKTMGIKALALGYDADFQPTFLPPYPTITGIDVLAECSQITALIVDRNTLDEGYIAADCGVGKGTTARFAVFNTGLPVAGVKALALTPSGNMLYAGLDGGGVYQSRVDKKLTAATEFYNPSLDYYFITSRPADVALLDTLTPWRRTGRSFNVYIAQEPGTLGINRYFFSQIAVNQSRGSHFYTLVQSEKNSLASLNPGNTQAPRLPFNEGVDSYAFAPLIEGVGGSCAAGQTPVYRVFRGQTRFPDNPNHRFTTDLSIYDSFVALGWDGEGVKFCVPN